jgi:hypothetical protein
MSNGTTTITVGDSTEQDAEYQVTPGPPFPEVEPPWNPIAAGQTVQLSVTLPVVVKFKISGVSQIPTGTITPGNTTATLAMVGNAYVVQIS